MKFLAASAGWRLGYVAAAAVFCTGCPGNPARPTPPAPCTWSLSTTSSSFPAAGGEGAISVTTGAGCAWSARTDAAWLTFTGSASGTGPGIVPFSVSVNADTSSRRATVTVADASLAIEQEGRPLGPCDYTVSPEMREFPPEGGTATITVSAEAHCEWTASSSDAWVIIVSGTSGTGNGTVVLSVAENGSTSERVATIVIAGRQVTIRQLPPAATSVCTYAVSPTSVSLDFRGTMPYTPPITVATEPACTWTASTDATWIRLGALAGSGAGSVPFTVDIYTEETTRSAPVKVRWPTITAGQNVWVTQTGCHFALGSTQASFRAAGGTGQVDVWNQEDVGLSGSGCPWTATSPVSWVRITSSLPRYGDDSVSFTVDPNTGAQRSAALTIAGKPFLVTQAGQ